MLQLQRSTRVVSRWNLLLLCAVVYGYYTYWFIHIWLYNALVFWIISTSLQQIHRPILRSDTPCIFSTSFWTLDVNCYFWRSQAEKAQKVLIRYYIWCDCVGCNHLILDPLLLHWYLRVRCLLWRLRFGVWMVQQEPKRHSDYSSMHLPLKRDRYSGILFLPNQYLGQLR